MIRNSSLTISISNGLVFVFIVNWTTLLGILALFVVPIYNSYQGLCRSGKWETSLLEVNPFIIFAVSVQTTRQPFSLSNGLEDLVPSSVRKSHREWLRPVEIRRLFYIFRGDRITSCVYNGFSWPTSNSVLHFTDTSSFSISFTGFDP